MRIKAGKPALPGEGALREASETNPKKCERLEGSGNGVSQTLQGVGT
jgi:hypothetical protein